MPTLWWAAGGATLIAILAALADRRRTKRADLDRITPVDWRTVQLAAIVAMLLLVSVALHLG
ncbi:crotonobetainyl-CoA:carnitine CoA-transferase CaiB-like acyl-CoA transferase [Sphingomonas jinjuensis]|uniref:Crotonobetainyl-CoA:carnitine CoA-transferase CaiB-like acyl-CoA transferase n=1 Tax=Sphingomonas jinjuensis TaxID=535907 RepID=A0A840FAX0_9SPHN|nr:hypothetical protein [Sphingomonas jinjuensis]MBB4153782.1 crotonobetainyl-CoA:carnitine CoA-transferase CaiB-like acyl-CoA transferase [Sphingomonas jinjuensis]